MSDHVHSNSCGPDTCFREKMRYMRARSSTIFGTPKMAPGVSWFDTTIAEETRKEMARAEAAGNSIEPVGSRWV